MPSPFRRILAAYDGSEAAQLALGYVIALGREGAEISLVHIVDETPIVAQSTTMVTAFDPGPLVAALDQAGRALLDDAAKRCRAAGIEPAVELGRGGHVAGILEAERGGNCDAIAIGTHGGGALEGALLGSVAIGVLRAADVPVLVVHPGTEAAGHRPFRRALVALDGSEPAEAAALLAASLHASLGTELVLCSVADTRDIYDKAAQFGYDPEPVRDEALAKGRAAIEAATLHANLSDATAAIVEGKPVTALLDAAHAHDADVVVMGSHGRRGLARLVLGSVAEAVVREAAVPVLVVRR